MVTTVVKSIAKKFYELNFSSKEVTLFKVEAKICLESHCCKKMLHYFGKLKTTENLRYRIRIYVLIATLLYLE
jgi:hypothetical protein